MSTRLLPSCRVLDYRSASMVARLPSRRRTSLCVSATVVLLAAVSAPAAIAAPAGIAGPAPVLPQPAQLQLLEQRMGQLQVTSERWAQTTDASALSEVEESGTGGRRRVTQRRTHIHTSARGEATVSPAASELFVAGRPSLLTVGSTLYLYSPEPRGVARARPWVRSAVPSLADVTARYPCGGEPSHEVSLGGSGAYAGLINLLATALAPIRVAGPVLVDGRQTTEFLAEVEPLALAKGLTAKQRADIHAHLGSERIEVFITEAGLPVRVVELTTS